jgi:DNA polymerase III subunit epsilon
VARTAIRIAGRPLVADRTASPAGGRTARVRNEGHSGRTAPGRMAQVRTVPRTDRDPVVEIPPPVSVVRSTMEVAEAMGTHQAQPLGPPERRRPGELDHRPSLQRMPAPRDGDRGEFVTPGSHADSVEPLTCHPASTLWPDGELLGFDFETTGADPFSDLPVSFALATVRGGAIVSILSSLVDPGHEVPHAASGLHGVATSRGRSEGLPLSGAVAFVSSRLIDASRRGVPVVGVNVDYDLTMLDRCYLRQTGRHLTDAGFRGPVIDALVLDRHVDRFRAGRRGLVELCKVYGVPLSRAHDVAEDAASAIAVVASICRSYPALRSTDPRELHRLQKRWHREWTASLAKWRRRRGLRALPNHDGWPIVRRSTASRTAWHAGQDARLLQPPTVVRQAAG